MSITWQHLAAPGSTRQHLVAPGSGRRHQVNSTRALYPTQPHQTMHMPIAVPHLALHSGLEPRLRLEEQLERSRSQLRLRVSLCTTRVAYVTEA